MNPVLATLRNVTLHKKGHIEETLRGTRLVVRVAISKRRKLRVVAAVAEVKK